MAERAGAVAVLDVDVGASLDQRLDGIDVVLAAISENDRLDQRGSSPDC
jgi:hypothetical protein